MGRGFESLRGHHAKVFRRKAFYFFFTKQCLFTNISASVPYESAENNAVLRFRLRIRDVLTHLYASFGDTLLFLMHSETGGKAMDQIKTGKLIADLRKEKGMTQVQLAQKIGVSDRTVSKWENGRGMPEYSLLLPLCQELEISVNELLSGERISEEEYRQKFEENFVETISETHKIFNRKRIITLCACAALLILFFFLTDLHRMQNGEPVIFGTWGFDYHQKEDTRILTAENVIREYAAEDGEKTKKIPDSRTFAAVKIYSISGTEDEFSAACWIRQGIFFNDEGSLKEESGYSIPCLVTIQKNGERYTVSEFILPGSGIHYTEDMRKMFSSAVIDEMEADQYNGTMSGLANEIIQQARQYFRL